MVFHYYYSLLKASGRKTSSFWHGDRRTTIISRDEVCNHTVKYLQASQLKMALYGKALLALRGEQRWREPLSEALAMTSTKLLVSMRCPIYEKLLIDMYMLAWEHKPNLNVVIRFEAVAGVTHSEYEVVFIGQGEGNYKEEFLAHSEGTPIVILSSKSKVADDYNNMQELKAGQYETVAVGGTFDHLHPGHKVLLSITGLLANKKIIVGLTADQLLQKKAHKEVLQPYNTRADTVSAFLKDINPDIDVEIVRLIDMYGPTVEISNIDALIVSQETRDNGSSVNNERGKRNMPPLAIHVIECLNQAAIKISSTDIRAKLVKQLPSNEGAHVIEE